MKKLVSLALVGVIVVAAFCAGILFSSTTRKSQPGQATRKVLYWVDPMHPSYKSDKPGIAPDCGMQLEPVYADDPSATPGVMPAGTVKIADERRQVIGVRTGTVEARPIERTIRTVGRVAVDENRLYRVLAPADGVVMQLAEFTSGTVVRHNDLLFTFFTRDYLRPQQVYFVALDYLDSATKGNAAPERLTQARGQVRVAMDDLINFGMSEIQIAELARTRKLTADIEVRSPVTGYVLARDVSPQMRFDRGAELYRIADLTKVWILVDVFEHENQELRPGTSVRVLPPYARTRPVQARVSKALPQFDADSRTMKVRLEADNADYALRPGMFVDAEIPVSLPAAITVPVDAVVDSGARKTVFVDRGNGYFEPRTVEAGWRLDDRVEIVSGLQAGDRIALSGTFLLDSESRMKAAAMGISTPVRDPVCGMEIDRQKAATAGRTTAFRGETYYFCSDDCKRKFTANPGAYTSDAKTPARDEAAPRRSPVAGLKPVAVPSLQSVPGATEPRAIWQRPPLLDMSGQVEYAEALGGERSLSLVIDAACGTVVVREDAERARLKSEYRGVMRYFSSKECKALFDLNPEKYVLANKQ